jgi:hypothetical protein
MRRLKRSTAFLQSSWDCLRGIRASSTGCAFARIKSRGDPRSLSNFPLSVRNTGDGCCYRTRVSGSGLLLIKAENVRAGCGDLAQVNIARCYVRVLSLTHRGLPLLPCDRTEAKKCEHYRYSYRYDRFGREFHCDLGVLQRRLEKKFLPSAARVEGNHAVNQERVVFSIAPANQPPPYGTQNVFHIKLTQLIV